MTGDPMQDTRSLVCKGQLSQFNVYTHLCTILFVSLLVPPIASFSDSSVLQGLFPADDLDEDVVGLTS